MHEIAKKWKDEKQQFVRITNDDLKCKDCIYRMHDDVIIGNTSKCHRYTTKPIDVLNGGNCELYEKEPK